jgi:hypothetical protein
VAVQVIVVRARRSDRERSFMQGTSREAFYIEPISGLLPSTGVFLRNFAKLYILSGDLEDEPQVNHQLCFLVYLEKIHEMKSKASEQEK